LSEGGRGRDSPQDLRQGRFGRSSQEGRRRLLSSKPHALPKQAAPYVDAAPIGLELLSKAPTTNPRGGSVFLIIGGGGRRSPRRSLGGGAELLGSSVACPRAPPSPLSSNGGLCLIRDASIRDQKRFLTRAAVPGPCQRLYTQAHAHNIQGRAQAPSPIFVYVLFLSWLFSEVHNLAAFS
jgi:hypothetical protein